MLVARPLALTVLATQCFAVIALDASQKHEGVMLATSLLEVVLLVLVPPSKCIWKKIRVPAPVQCMQCSGKMCKHWSPASQARGRSGPTPAKAPTAEEFVDFLGDVDAIMKAHKQAPYYVYDNPYFHVGKTAQQYMQCKGLENVDRFKIPPYSPEFNKVIEHSHARLEKEVEMGLSANPQAWGFEGVAKVIIQAFCKVNDPSVVSRDVLSLPRTYLAIQNAKGGHIARKLR